MKRLLSLLLALIFVLSMAACAETSSDNGDTEKESKSAAASTDKATEPPVTLPDTTPSATVTEAEARRVAEGFMDAYMSLDNDEAIKYADDPTAVPDTSEATKVFEAVKTVPAGLEAYSEEWIALIDIVLERMYAAFSYSITKTEKTSTNEYTFTVNMTVPNASNAEIQNALSVITVHFTKDNLAAVATELKNAGKITQSMTQQEMVDIVMKELFKDAEESAKGILFKTSTATQKLVVNTNTGTLLVDTKASGMKAN